MKEWSLLHSWGKMEDHSLDKSRWSSPRRFTVLDGNGLWGREKEEHHGEGPDWAGQQTAAKVTNSVIKEESCIALSTLIHRAAHCVWTLSWHGSWLLCSIDFLCHRQYYCSWKVHYFFKLPNSEKGIFFEGFCHISLKNRKSVICIFLCMFTGTKKKEKKEEKNSFTLSFG